MLKMQAIAGWDKVIHLTFYLFMSINDIHLPCGTSGSRMALISPSHPICFSVGAVVVLKWSDMADLYAQDQTNL